MWSSAALGHQHEYLSLEGIAHWNYHPPAGLQLPDQWRWDVVGGGCYDDAVKGPLLGPTEVTVANAYFNVLVTESVQAPACGRAQWLDDFDGIDFCDQR
jgi:hypothetical protein